MAKKRKKSKKPRSENGANTRAVFAPVVGEVVRKQAGACSRKQDSFAPRAIPIVREERFHTHYVGRLEGGQQVMGFVVATLPSEVGPPPENWEEHKWWYAVVHRFDKEGGHLETTARFAGRTVDGERDVIARAWEYLAELLDELPPIHYRDVFVRLFSVEIHGRRFGLVDDSEPANDYERITLWPNDLVFFPPYDGLYET